MRFGDIFGIGGKMLEIEIGSELIDGIKDLAIRHYGDNGDNSVSRVVENALFEKIGSHRNRREKRQRPRFKTGYSGEDHHD